ncbi:MAG: PD-(D/E)XK nuclease family protein [Spirochaetales bacterium]|nr:PD-(D/E)XK nuclease family protein [Spirochaetales bacterium]
MEKKYADIITLLSDNDTVYVFPSEIAAREWADYMLLCSDRPALDAGRYISWDKFKETTFQLFRSEKPVNRELRRLYAMHLLERNKQDNSLDFLIPQKYAEYGQSFRRTVEAVLMSLNSAERLDNIALGQVYGRKLKKVFAQYACFLKDRSLYEPAGISPRLDMGGKRHLVFFPEVISDFSEYRTLLTAHDRVAFFHTRDQAGSGPLREFRTVSQEINWIADSFAQTLSKNPDAVTVLSCAGNAEMLDNILALFRLRGIPYSERIGKPLGSCPGTALFRHLRTLLADPADLQSLSSAVFDNALVWKDVADLREMVSFLADMNFVKNPPSGRRDRLESLLDSSENSMYTEWYKTLRSNLRVISRCRDFDELGKALSDFVFGFMDFSAFDEEAKKEYQLAIKDLAALSGLNSMVAEFGLTDLFGFFADSLDNHVYVSRRDSRGVQVYPYRVAAGIPADLHIVCGCTRAAVQVRQRPFSFLNESQRYALQLEDSDSGDDFLQTYLYTGAVCTGSRQGFGGSELPPGLFIRTGRISAMEDTVLPEDSEKALWKNEKAVTGRWSSEYARVLEKKLPVLTAFDGSGRDMAVLDGALLEALVRAAGRDGLIRISATRLQAWYGCPFSFLYERLIGLEEKAYKAAFIDHAIIGIIEHNTLERFFLMTGSDKKPLSDRTDTELQSILDTAFREAAKRYHEPYFAPAWQADLVRTRNDIFRWLGQEKDTFSATLTTALERNYEYEDRKAGVLYEGKIDRVALNEGGEFIIDYKKGKPDGNAGIAAHDMLAGSKQLPFYILLMRKNGHDPTGAWYYSFREGKYQQVWLSKQFSEKQMDELTGWLETKTGEAAAGIRAGIFPASEGSCDHCSFRSLCRIKFVLP